MSAERRRHDDDSLPSDEGATDPQGWTAGAEGRHGGGRAGQAWSAEFHHDPDPRGGRADWPGDAQLDQEWAGSYRFDGRRSDEPWRDPAQHDSSPAGQAWRHEDAAADGSGDNWIDRTQVDQSWRYRSLADDRLADDRPEPDQAGGLAVDPFATDLYAGDYASGSRPSGTHVIGGRRASDSWLSTQADERIPAVGGQARDGLATGEQPSTGRRDGSGQDDGGRAGRGRASRGEAGGTQLGGPQPGGGGRDGWDGGDWGGSDWGGSSRPGGRRRILVSVLAAAAVALAFGAYGLVRMHDQSTLALQDSSSRPCGAHAGRCHSHPPRPPGPGSSSPVVSDSGLPGSSMSPTTGASGTPSTAPSHTAPPVSMPASVAPPTHSAPPPPAPAPKPSASASQGTGTASSAAAARVLDVINQARAQQGLPALAISSGLNASSGAHTSVMAGDCGLSHQCPGEPPLGTRISNAGVQWTSAGENIGEGGPVANNATAITQMAVNLTQSMLNEQPPDDGHRMNILSSSFRFTGITVFIDSRGTVWMAQDFSG